MEVLEGNFRLKEWNDSRSRKTQGTGEKKRLSSSEHWQGWAREMENKVKKINWSLWTSKRYGLWCSGTGKEPPSLSWHLEGEQSWKYREACGHKGFGWNLGLAADWSFRQRQGNNQKGCQGFKALELVSSLREQILKPQIAWVKILAPY